MNTTIQNNGLPNFTQAAASPGNGSAPAPTAAGTANASATPGTDDQLKLTDSARALQEAARLDTAAVDPQRVERIRQALADGSYQINPGKIADRMLSLEQQIGGPGKS